MAAPVLAPIPLPVLTGNRQIARLPSAPAVPPTDADITKAVHFAAELIEDNGRDVQSTPDIDVVEAIIYKSKLLASRDGQEPAWFGPAMNRILGPIKTKLDKIDIRSAKLHNGTIGSGDDAIYDVVPFPDGSDPTGPPHNLPPLTSPAALRMLSNQDLKRYYRRYHSMAPNAGTPTADECRRAVIRAIGAKRAAGE